MSAAPSQQVEQAVAKAALGRAVLLGRAAATMTAAAAGLQLVDAPRRLVAVLGIAVIVTIAGCTTVTRRPGVVRWPLPIIAVDSLIVLGVLVVNRGGVAYFCWAAGACALAGVLLGMRGVLVWAAHAAVGYVVAANLLHAAAPPADLAAFVVAFPMADVLAGIGAAVATAALSHYVDLSVEVVASAQRSAVASERARLARELHDSVTKTLRGVSFAALALPSSLRRHPALAEQLASTVSNGAAAAAKEARELLEALRLDTPDQEFAEAVDHICRQWSDSTRVPVQVTVAPLEPAVAVRYELTRILNEALRNIAQHAEAQHVEVSLIRVDNGLRLSVRDDGVGFNLPDDPTTLRAGGSFGIIGMFERAKSVQGTVRMTSMLGRGTTLEVWTPIDEAPPATLLPVAQDTDTGMSR